MLFESGTGRRRARKARQRMLTRYCPEVLAKELAGHFRRIDALIPK